MHNLTYLFGAFTSKWRKEKTNTPLAATSPLAYSTIQTHTGDNHTQLKIFCSSLRPTTASPLIYTLIPLFFHPIPRRRS